MKHLTTVTMNVTIEYDDGLSEGNVQDAVLQNFPEKIAGQHIHFVRIIAGMVDSDGVPIQPRVAKDRGLMR